MRAGGWWLATLGLLAAPAGAAGFDFGENGARALAQGGAFVGQADDETALQFNPAGLAQRRGLGLLLDGALLQHSVRFHRQDPGFDPSAPSTLTRPVENGAGPFLTGFGAAWGSVELLGRTLVVAAGVYGPPAVGRYSFPAPSYARGPDGAYLETPNRLAPQRYALVASETAILYPTLAVAYALHPRVLLGVSLQLVWSRFSLQQAVYSELLTTPQRQTQERPEWDDVVTVEAAGWLRFTAVAGVLVKPTDWLQVGASFRPPVPLSATGTLRLALGEGTRGAGAVVQGEGAELSLTLPWDARLGVLVRPSPAVSLALDVVLQGWSTVDAITLTPRDVSFTLLGSQSQVAPFRIEKRWDVTVSVRGGVRVTPLPWLSLAAGAWYETSAAPLATYSLDFAHPARLFLTGGAEVALGPVRLVAAVAGTPSVRTVVQQSDVRAGHTSPGTPGQVVGLGLYDSGGWLASLGLRGHLPWPGE